MIAKALWAALTFVIGSIPFAVVLARVTGVGDVRQVGDGNPGATNAWKLAGWKLGVPVLALDFLKAALPVAIARWLWAWDGPWLAVVACAPVLGHGFSPFLRGRGGKGLAATFGVWTALTLAHGPLVFGGTLLFCRLVLRLGDGWSVALGLLALLGELLWRGSPATYLFIWTILSIWLLWAYRQDWTRAQTGAMTGE